MAPNLALQSSFQADFPGQNKFCVRQATATDITALIHLKLQMSAADGTTALVNALVEAWVRDGFGTARKFAAFVAEQAGVLVGMIIFNEQQFAGWSRPSIYVQDVFVVPACRNAGIGQSLLANVAAYAHERDAALLYLNVRDDNPACRLYEDLGFESSTHCKTYALCGPALHALGARSSDQTDDPD